MSERKESVNMKSWLPQGGENLFQGIKKRCAEAEAKGIKVWRLTIGQPTGAAFLSARQACADLVMSDQERVHEYQDNGSPGVPDFARKFVLQHIKDVSIREMLLAAGDEYGWLPIPGIKPMLGLMPLACGRTFRSQLNVAKVGHMTNPGYAVPATWCDYLDFDSYALPTNPENAFRFSAADIRPGTALLMLNYPHNPSGQVAEAEWWEEICAACQQRGIRLFNDSAYSALTHTQHAYALSEVAVNFSRLSWAEAFSASKLIGNGTGWRVGAIVGSKDFVSDIATIKGNTDSGAFAPAMAGALESLLHDLERIIEHRFKYQVRIGILSEHLVSRGMELAVYPSAGFFTLWLAPKQAFGQEIADGKAFNNLMIDKTGVAGVPFGRYIRYAVTSPIEESAWQKAITAAFDAAQVKY